MPAQTREPPALPGLGPEEMGQILQSLTPEERQQIFEALTRNSGAASGKGMRNGQRPETVIRPLPPPPVERLPTFGNLTPFGYDLFLGTPTTFAPTGEVPVPRDYVLGPGDVLRVQYYGSENNEFRLTVARDGSVTVPRLGPLQAAGLGFDAFRRTLQERVSTQLIGVRAAVTLDELRSIRVFVLGEANVPGAYTVSSLATMTNALFVSGGVSLYGSLRDVQLKRNGRVVQRLDVYELLLSGDTRGDARLHSGDVIFIPPVGPRVGISGAVKRPAVYELRGEATAWELAQLAGGFLPTTDLGAAQIERILPDGHRGLLQLRLDQDEGRDLKVQNGDILHVHAVPQRLREVVQISGYVHRGGQFAWSEGMTVGALLRQAEGLILGIGREPYTLAGVLERTDPLTRLRHLQLFELARVVSGESEGPALRPDDHVLILSRDDIAFLSSDAVYAVLNGKSGWKPPRDQLDAGGQAPEQVFGQHVPPEHMTPGLAQAAAQDPARAAAVAAALQGASSNGNAAAARAHPLATPGSGAAAGQAGTTGDAAMPGTPGAAGPAGTGPGAAALADTSCPALDELSEILNSQRSARLAIAQISQGVRAHLRVRRRMDCPPIYKLAPAILPFLLEYGVVVQGEVRAPGIYPVADQTDLGLVLAAAGGLSTEADPSNVELLSTAEEAPLRGHSRRIDGPLAGGHPVRPGDVVNVRPRYSRQEFGTVLVRGEVRFPGTYTVARGETLSQLIARAGGLTEQAYPYGAVFTRESARQAEQEAYQRAANDLQEALVTAMTSGIFARESESVADLLSVLINRLENAQAVGRITIEADPAILQTHPERDVVLEPGDAFYVPKRPSSVTVTGQVLNSGSFAFRSGRDADDYISLAGGFSEAADRERAFIVYPDGSAKALQLSFWNFERLKVPPGSTIVVPRDTTRLSPLVLTERIASILANMAVSAAALVTINNAN